MACFFYYGVMSLLSVLVTCQLVPDGVRMECHERYFMIAVDRSFEAAQAHFEAVDRTGVYVITESYAAKCGYSITVLQSGYMELRASYFSCHTANQGDQVFTFSFNLLARRNGSEAVYALNETCSPLLAWSPREVTCEVNYMEVSVRSEVSCTAGTQMDDWNILKSAHSSSTSDWQVMFQKHEEQLAPMSLSDARGRGYVFELTDGRLVFRAPYEQPHSFVTMVNGVPVEVVHATLFSRQSWFVIMVDLLAACSVYEGTFEDNGHVVFETPEALYPSPDVTEILVGLNSELLERSVFAEKGAIEIKKDIVQVRIPFHMEGGHRKSFVNGQLYEFYTFHLHLEQLFEKKATRLRLHRILATPLRRHPLLTQNQTVVEEHMFTVYLGNVPEDVELLSFQLNGHEMLQPFANTSAYVETIVQENNEHGYTLKVPFDDPAIMQKFWDAQSVKHSLDINYTLRVLPENKLYCQTVSVSALTDVYPPVMNAVCSETGITFRLDHRPLNFLWFFSVGSDMVTSELAAQRGYRMSNDSRSLQLSVPVFTQGFQYTEITLEGFLGTFEILVRDCETSAVQGSITKTCPFAFSEVIACSMDGRMTVLADLAFITPSGVMSSTSNLLDVYCGPTEADGTKALFSFPLNSCGSEVEIDKNKVHYRNEIFYNGSEHSNERVVVQCTYPLDGLHRLFSMHKFESDSPGSGSIIHSKQPTAASQHRTIQTTTGQTRAPATSRTSRGPDVKRPASHHGNVRYIKVLRGKPYLDVRQSPYFRERKY
ncbi:uncharacterized protein [Nerophis lumbriciformis]|uniref:uncharacterized protein n=1 Tax=Nerophis lumbriciformis TaxID=546530 RepID=UPI002ADF40CB|nr:uncharacterized protein LOC133605646 [Nerophis lumbriciformis]